MVWSKQSKLLWKRIALVFSIIVFIAGISNIAVLSYIYYSTFKRVAVFGAFHAAKKVNEELNFLLSVYIEDLEFIVNLIEHGIVRDKDEIHRLLVSLNSFHPELKTICFLRNNTHICSNCYDINWDKYLPKENNTVSDVKFINEIKENAMIITHSFSGEQLISVLPVYNLWNKLSQNIPMDKFDIYVIDRSGHLIFSPKLSTVISTKKNIIDSEKLKQMQFIPSQDRFGFTAMAKFKASSRPVYFLIGFVWGWVMLVILVIVFLSISYILSKRMLGDLHQIYPFIERISKGDFEGKLDIKRDDEIGVLAEYVNRMVDEIKKYRCRSNIWAVGNAVAWIRHEIKNKLVPVKAFLEGLPNRCDGSEFVNKLGNIALKEVIDCESLLSELSLLGNKILLHRENVNLAPFLYDVVNRFSMMVFNKDISLFVECSDYLTICIDKDKFALCLYNVILNAIEAMGDKGEIHVKAYVDGKFTVIEIKDTGPGIPEPIRSRAFEPFVSGKSEDGIYRRRGIGLTIVYNLVNAHGGEIFFETDEETGTTFFIKIPNRCLESGKIS